MKAVVIEISSDLIESALCEGNQVQRMTVATGLPEGAKLVGAFWRDLSDRTGGLEGRMPGTVMLVFAHESFEATPEGTPIVNLPRITVELQQNFNGADLVH